MSKGPYIGMLRQAAGAWIGLAAAWSVILVGGLLWIAGGVATWLMGEGFPQPTFDFQTAEDILLGGTAAVWPHAPMALIAVVFALELAVLSIPAAVVLVGSRRRQRGQADPARSLALEDDLRDLTPDGVRERALALRPSYAEKLGGRDRRSFPLTEAGVPIGALDRTGTELRASWEDVALAIMAPRSGKTTAEAIPAILDAPGAALVTSNKADVWAATAALRDDGDDGPRHAWVFDPQDIAHAPQRWWWNPLEDVRTFEDALRLATHFMQEVKDTDRGAGDDAFWTSAATDVLTGLFLAAGLEGYFLEQVYEWLNDPAHPEPVDILEKRGDHAAARSLEVRQTSSEETRDGIYEFARTACRCLRNQKILEWVRPREESPEATVSEYEDTRTIDLSKGSGERLTKFDPKAFAASRDTMYLLSKDGAAAAAPLVAALTDRILVEGIQLAERQERGRLDPPMVVVLDEAANICKIADLPLLYSHLGSRGIFVLTILQSRPQARQVWGRDGFETMWSAATIKLVGAGIDDPELAEDISRLVGEHDISVRSVSTGNEGAYSESVSLRKESIMSPSAVRAMPKGSAILLATGSVPASIRLLPWYRSSRARKIREAIETAQIEMTRNARETARRPETIDLRTEPPVAALPPGNRLALPAPPGPGGDASRWQPVTSVPGATTATAEPPAPGATAPVSTETGTAPDVSPNLLVISPDGDDDATDGSRRRISSRPRIPRRRRR